MVACWGSSWLFSSLKYLWDRTDTWVREINIFLSLSAIEAKHNSEWGCEAVGTSAIFIWNSSSPGTLKTPFSAWVSNAAFDPWLGNYSLILLPAASRQTQTLQSGLWCHVSLQYRWIWFCFGYQNILFTVILSRKEEYHRLGALWHFSIHSCQLYWK